MTARSSNSARREPCLMFCSESGVSVRVPHTPASSPDSAYETYVHTTGQPSARNFVASSLMYSIWFGSVSYAVLNSSVFVYAFWTSTLTSAAFLPKPKRARLGFAFTSSQIWRAVLSDSSMEAPSLVGFAPRHATGGAAVVTYGPHHIELPPTGSPGPRWAVNARAPLLREGRLLHVRPV